MERSSVSPSIELDNIDGAHRLGGYRGPPGCTSMRWKRFLKGPDSHHHVAAVWVTAGRCAKAALQAAFSALKLHQNPVKQNNGKANWARRIILMVEALVTQDTDMTDSQ